MIYEPSKLQQEAVISGHAYHTHTDVPAWERLTDTSACRLNAFFCI